MRRTLDELRQLHEHGTKRQRRQSGKVLRQVEQRHSLSDSFRRIAMERQNTISTAPEQP